MVEKELRLASCDAAATGNCIVDFRVSTSKYPFLLWAHNSSVNRPRTFATETCVQDGVGVEIHKQQSAGKSTSCILNNM